MGALELSKDNDGLDYYWRLKPPAWLKINKVKSPRSMEKPKRTKLQYLKSTQDKIYY